MPEALAGRLGCREIHRSLHTVAYREATERATRAWLATEKLFAEMRRNSDLKARQAKLYLDQLLAEPVLASPSADELVEDLVQGGGLARLLFNETAADLIMEMAEHERRHIAQHMVSIADRFEVHTARLAQAVAQDRAEISRHDAATAEARTAELEDESRKSEVAVQVAKRLHEIAAASVPAPAPAVQVQETVEPDSKPRKLSKGVLCSKLAIDFIAEKTRVVDNHREYDQQTVKQTEATIHLWTEIVGDRRMSEYEGADVTTFRNTVLRLPSSHGKSGTRAAIRKLVPPLEAIRVADEKQKAIDSRNALLPPDAPREASVPRLKMKTLKRHFSTMSQLWLHYATPEQIPRDRNPFRGWTYQGVKRGGKKKRGPFSSDDLNKLLASAWMDRMDRRWVVLVSLFAGLRVEEIFRLRPSKDIQILHGVPCFVIQEHPAPDKWSPKTEAGERVVPVHSVLLSLGFMEHVEARRESGARRLFAADLRPSTNKLSAKFVRDFSREKSGLGIGRMTTFHSARHNISTTLRNTPARDIREFWIDAILGHEGGEDDEGNTRKRSEGVITYMDSVAIRNLLTTVEGIEYPGVDLSVLGHQARLPDAS